MKGGAEMNYQNITSPDMNNGSGLRCVLWVSGCTHHCINCQNPQTWDCQSGIPFDKSAKKEILEELSRDYISGLTLSGGDPLHPQNVQEITLLIKEVKKKFPNKNIWLYTGFIFEDIQDLELIQYIDVLVDGKYIEELRDVKLHWCGSSNQRIIDVQKTLNNEDKSIVLYED